MIALIPARAGSKRIPGKNMKSLAGYPLIAYTLAAAKQSQLFDEILVCSDDPDLLAYVETHWLWARTFQREPVPDDQPDVVWVKQALHSRERRYKTFAILRPTSPFRTADTLRKGAKAFLGALSADSVRAVEKVSQHPGKMWTWEGLGYGIQPLLNKQQQGVPWHSSPTQSLPDYYVQNSSLEIAWTANVEVHGTIHGRSVYPLFTEGYEGFSIDYARDWREAEYLIASGAAHLPEIPVAPLSAAPEVRETDSRRPLAW